MPWIFSVSNEKHSGASFNIRPTCQAYLFLAHGCCHGEADDTAERSNLALFLVKMGYESVELVLCRATIAFFTSPDKAKPFEGNASQIDRLNPYRQSVNSRSVRQNMLDHPNVDAEGHGACALSSAFSAKADQPLPIN